MRGGNADPGICRSPWANLRALWGQEKINDLGNMLRTNELQSDLARKVIERRAQMSESQRFLAAQLIRFGATTDSLAAENALRP
jgi:hypothetical protein